VVDAGGRGWCVLLQALEAVITGQAAAAEPTLLVARDRSGLAAAREAGSEEFAYEVQFLLRDTTDAAVAALKTDLGALGDSLVVVGGDGLFNVHVHVYDVGAAVEAGVEAGRPFRITVTRFEDQVAGAPLTGRAVVAVAAGAGTAALFRSAGASVVDGGPTANPSTAELLAAIRATGAAEVVVLPNDGNVRAVAVAAAEQADATVHVIPTRSVVQGLAAVSVADPALDLVDDLAAMTAAADGTRWAEVTTAVRDSHTPVGPCRQGDVLGLVLGTVVLVGDDPQQVCLALLDRLLADGGEVVTVLLGERAEAPDRLVAHLAHTHPQVEVQVLDGGQRHYPYLLGVE
jgi:dihydroxyacetone kinase-like predicted kinase